MYELVALAAILIGILLFSKTRERLTPTPKIKSAGGYINPDPTEVDYRWSIAPQPVKDELLKFVNTATFPVYASLQTPEEKAKRFTSLLIERFYEDVYLPSTSKASSNSNALQLPEAALRVESFREKMTESPITEKKIDDYVARIFRDMVEAPPNKNIKPEMRNAYKSLIDSGALKQLLMAYYIGSPATPAVPAFTYMPPPISDVVNIPVGSMPPEFAQALEVYRMNYVEYRTSGKVAFKTAYEAAEKWIQTYMDNLRKKLQQDAEYVGKFTQEYAAMNPELSELQGKMKKIQVEGPQLQDKYTTVKNLDQTVPPDTTSYYVKGAVAAAVVGIIVVFSFF